MFHRLVCAFLAVLLGFSACSRRVQRQIVQPNQTATLDGKAGFLKAHMRDGDVYVLARWKVDEPERIITGEGVLYGPDRAEKESGALRVELDEVALFETNRVVTSPSVSALAVLTGISAAITIYCAANPKSCFGSCPTFYVQGPTGLALRSEGFSASVAPVLEATDIDALGEVRAERQVKIEMRNEAFETHVVRHVDLLAVPRPSGGRVFATSNGEFWRASHAAAPRQCTAREGDCTSILSQQDGIERWSEADSFNLATRETIELLFDVEAGGEMGIAIASRQSLLSTFLFYQTLAHMGSRAAEWIARLERGDMAMRDRAGSIGRLLGGIEVQLPDERGGWSTVGSTSETGPLATDVRIVRLGRLSSGPIRVRLRLTRGYWRLDQVGLVSLDQPVEPLRIPPSEVLDANSRRGRALERLIDPAQQLVTLPGDRYTLFYDLPRPASYYELFLESRGYYLEWMRQEWIAEENIERALVAFLKPEQALRLAAPEFKRWEEQMEERFWGSRYVRP